MSDARVAMGRHGEALAVAALEANGWQVLATNWRCRAGEIDVVAQDGETLVLVEVRTKRSGRFGTPEESVGFQKRRKLLQLGMLYTQAVRWPGPWRIDVVAVELDKQGELVRLNHVQHAVRAN